eukprot:8034436-Karenia_brevis.AAC.1
MQHGQLDMATVNGLSDIGSEGLYGNNCCRDLMLFVGASSSIIIIISRSQHKSFTHILSSKTNIGPPLSS